MSKVYTSNIRYAGPGRLDVTAKGFDPIGRHFAPDWEQVKAYLASARDAQAEYDYSVAYHAKMTLSLTHNVSIWDHVILGDDVVLVCYCKAGQFCHRNLLKGYLVHLGMEDGGEVR